MTGVELIAQEREEQIEKHGYDVQKDIKYYSDRQLVKAALFVLTEKTEIYPSNWDTWFLENMSKKRSSMTAREYELERLKIAGALIAAEIDRLQNIKY